MQNLIILGVVNVSSSINAPLYNQLLNHLNKQPMRFHVPGHKGGHFYLKEGLAYYKKILQLDLTELSGLDDLHAPTECIKEAQALAAQCFFAEQSYFLINGSTVGNLAMVMGTIKEGDTVLLQRDSHKSVYHALAMVGAEVVLINPLICDQFQIGMGLKLEDLQTAYNQYPDAKAIILTHPNYYGVIYPLTPIVVWAKSVGLLVLVDEAHGAHLGFHKGLSQSAMQAGADVSVQSTHKMLGSLTMSAMLHIRGNHVNKEAIEWYLRSLQSSSPSYPLLASLDLARAQVQNISARQWQESIDFCQQLKNQIQAIGYTVLESKLLNYQGINYDCDPFKLTIQSTLKGLTGPILKEFLEQENLYVELSDPCNVCLTLPIRPHKKWSQDLLKALTHIKANQATSEGIERSCPSTISTNYVERLYIEQQLFHKIALKVPISMQKKEVPISESSGFRAAEMIIPYPPGIPIILPGQLITEEIIEHLMFLKENNISFQGKEKGFKTLCVELNE
jgi:arginine/lysine/ornithine decarboxylase